MDGQQFDRLTQQFGRALTRRRFGAVLAALGFGTALGSAPDAEARKNKKKKKKKPKKCKNGAVRCGSACIDTKTNAAHCGGCGSACPSGQSCANGACQGGGCDGDRELCGAECVNLDNNEAHCGECGRACAGDLTCLDGECDCADGVKCGNECVDLQSDPDHCGACDDPCDGECVGGECNTAGCGQNQIDCGGGLCIPDHEHACCSQIQCGGDNSQLRCDTDLHRCVCKNSGEGICRRSVTGGGGACHTCCPGGDEVCLRDHVCFVLDSDLGPIGLCNCPTGYQVCHFGVSHRCSQDYLTDLRRCGIECKDCTIDNPGSRCCQGGCARGKNPGQSGESGGLCGNNCLPCPTGQICCNSGPGTSGECVVSSSGACPG